MTNALYSADWRTGFETQARTPASRALRTSSCCAIGISVMMRGSTGATSARNASIKSECAVPLQSVVDHENIVLRTGSSGPSRLVQSLSGGVDGMSQRLICVRSTLLVAALLVAMSTRTPARLPSNNTCRQVGGAASNCKQSADDARARLVDEQTGSFLDWASRQSQHVHCPILLERGPVTSTAISNPTQNNNCGFKPEGAS